MAERRMFAKSIIDSDMFLDMSLSTQALYFHLAMRADDDGFVNNPKRIQRMVGSSDDEMKILIAKQYILPFESGVVVIKHWKIHNYIQKDRYRPSELPEKQLVKVEKNKAYELLDTECIQIGSIGKDRLGKDRLGNTNTTKAAKPLCVSEDCSPELAEALKAFEEHRKKMRKPMTDYAKKLLIGKLQKLAATEAEQVAIINQSIENGWQGIFPLGGDKGRGSRSAADMAEGVKQKLRDRGLLHDGEGENSGNGNAGSRPSWFS